MTRLAFAIAIISVHASHGADVETVIEPANLTLRSGSGPLEKLVRYCTCHCCQGRTTGSPAHLGGCMLPLPIGWIPCLPGVYVENSCSVCGTTTPKPSPSCLPIKNVTGSWVQIQSSSSSQSVEFEIGVTRSYTISDTNTWGSSVSANAGVNFGFDGVGISAGVSGSISHSIAKEYTSEFSMTKTETHTFQYGAGVVWQFQFTIVDQCGSSTVTGDDMALTPGAFEPPCCLPGYSKNISTPHGSCVAGPNVCKPSVDSVIVHV